MARLLACDWHDCTTTTDIDNITDRWLHVEVMSSIHRMHEKNELHFCGAEHIVAFYNERIRSHMT
jgi:hypothetical protein